MIIDLSEYEAAVLSNLLYKNTHSTEFIKTHNAVERQVLWNLECLIEKI